MRAEEYTTLEVEARERYLEGLSAEELLEQGVELFNAGEYWHAHEAWEVVWLDAERADRYFYQGLIQVAAAFVHLVRREYPGTVSLLDAGLEKLEPYPESFRGVALGRLLAGVKAARVEVVRLGAKRLGEYDRSLIPRIEISRPGQAV